MVIGIAIHDDRPMGSLDAEGSTLLVFR